MALVLQRETVHISEASPGSRLGVAIQTKPSFGRGVPMNSVITHAGDRHNDQRLDETFLNQFLCGFVCPPLHSAESGGSVEDVLTVVQVKDWVPSPGRPPIPRGKINQNLPLILQNLRWKSCVTLDVPGQGMVGHLFFELRRAPEVEARRAPLNSH